MDIPFTRPVVVRNLGRSVDTQATVTCDPTEAVSLPSVYELSMVSFPMPFGGANRGTCLPALLSRGPQRRGTHSIDAFVVGCPGLG